MSETDQTARVQALDVSQSFLMQAPAGSGKTEVLTQRFLALLAVVDHPEQILALTFTKKAAAEMRYRLLHALYLGQEPAPTSEPALSRWHLAQAVLEANHQKQWHLLSSPHRLRLYTIDSLCATLVKQSPLMVTYSGFRICAQAQPFYEQAVRNTLFAVDEPWLESLQRLLLYFNTDYGYFQGLLENMLASRETWIGDALTISDGLADSRFSKTSVLMLFEQQLQSVQQGLAQRLAKGFKGFAWAEFWPLVCFSQQQLGGDLDADLTPKDLQPEHWKILADLVLKKNGDLRQRLDKKCGFPATAKAQKQAMEIQLSLVAELDWSTLQACFKLLQAAPAAYNADPQHDLAFDIFQLGLASVTQLEKLFKKAHQVDYAGLAQSALESLGDESNPTDVLLRFDYQVQHLLMDEFQDTSGTQMQLFERMTTGWQAGDGRSLFFVGDPMQSIYGFRKADVNLFYQIQQQGLGEMPLKFLQLQRNFRTEPALVHEVQTLLSPLFPAQEDALLQQVTFAKAIPARTQNTASKPCDARLFETREQEVSWLTQQVHLTLQEQAASQASPGRIAILVRKKSQVPAMTRSFRQVGIAYTAVDLDPLWAFTSVKDVYHLACVLFEAPTAHHFFAVCRAPFIGLGLPALELVAALWAADPGLVKYRDGRVRSLAHPIEPGMKHRPQNALLSDEDHQRLLAFLNVLDRFQKSSALSTVERLRGLWFCLLGPETTPEEEQQSMNDFWSLLEVQSENSLELPALRTALERANTSVIDPNARVEIMTIHKSKGLEYDTVFVPCLDDFSGRGSTPLVETLGFQMPQEPQQTLFAVRASTDKEAKGTAGASVAGFIREIVKCRDRNELSRLLYVAVTRAERQLRLSATLKLNSKGVQVPTAGSVLARLMPCFDVEQAIEQPNSTQEFGPFRALSPSTIGTLVRRSPFVLPLEKPLTRQPSQYAHYWPAQILKSQASLLPQQFGQLIHLWFSQLQPDQLEHIVPGQWRAWFANAITSFGWRLENQEAVLDGCIQLVKVVVADAKKSPVVNWMLQARPAQWREHAWQVLNVQGEGHLTLRPDLVFIDAEKAQLWIVDYKVSSSFLGASTCQNLDAPDTLQSIQQAYGDQLLQYAQVFAWQMNGKTKDEQSKGTLENLADSAVAELKGYSAIYMAVYHPTPAGPEFWYWPLGL